MKIIAKARDLDGDQGRGIDICVLGFKGHPNEVEPSQVFMEVYDGKLRIHVWTGESENPQTIAIDPEEK